MANINEIAGAIAKEVDEQGEKLESLHEDITKADENVEKGVQNLKEAAVHQKKSGKCMGLLVGVIVVCIIILFAFIFSG